MAINYWLSIILFIFSVVTLMGGIYSLRIKYSDSAAVLGIFAIVVAVYCSGYAVEIIGNSLGTMKMFHNIKMLALPMMSGLVLIMTLKAVTKNKKISFWFFALLYIIPLITIILRMTYNYQSLYYYDFVLNTQGQFNILEYRTGFWYYVFAAYCIITLSSSIIIHFINIIKKKEARHSSILMILALAIPLISGIITIAGVTIGGYIILPFTLPFSAVLLFIGTVRYGMFDLVPLAHSKVFEWSDNGIIVLDSNLCLVDINPSAKSIFPQISGRSFGKNIKDHIDENGQIKAAIKSDTGCRIEIKKDDEIFYYKINSAALLNANNVTTGYMVNVVDVTELVNARDELDLLVSIDTLTGVQTRRHFSERAQVEFSRAKRFKHALSFIILDLDLFKNVNDEFGHIAGDNLLKSITSICKKVIRSIDLLGRFGGEEFMILLPETGIEGAVIVAERIRVLVEQSILLFESNEIETTISLGVTGVDEVTTENLDKFLKYADKALYKAKKKGRNRVEVLPVK